MRPIRRLQTLKVTLKRVRCWQAKLSALFRAYLPAAEIIRTMTEDTHDVIRRLAELS